MHRWETLVYQPRGARHRAAADSDLHEAVRRRAERTRLDELSRHARRLSPPAMRLADELTHRIVRALLEPALTRADLANPGHRAVLASFADDAR